MLENSRVGEKFPGIFRGQVISHLPCGRCKIWIPDVYPEEWAKEKSSELKDVYGEDLVGVKLPDAEQASPLFGGAMKGNGSFSYPKKNSFVWCMFERDDIQRPIYFAAVIDTTDMGNGSSFSDVTTDTKSGTVLKHEIKCGKSTILVDEAGKITISVESEGAKKPSIILNAEDNSITLDAETVSITGTNIAVGTKNTKSVNLTSGENINVIADNLVNTDSGMFMLFTDGTCQIHYTEFNPHV